MRRHTHNRKRIPLSQVAVGMKIVSLDMSWLQTPFLSHRMHVRSKRQIQRLRSVGVRYVVVESPAVNTQPEPSTGQPGEGIPAQLALESDTDAESVLHPPFPEGMAPEPIVPFEEELPFATQAYRQAITIAGRALEEVRMGKAFHTEAIHGLAETFTESVLRNPDALTSLTRLKQLDQYTFFHSVNTSILALALGKSTGMPRQSLVTLGIGSLLHDIGKMKVPVEILNKPRRYRPHEFEIVKQHALRGAEILQSQTSLSPDSVRPALEHHERIDGTGYPFERTKQELSEFGMISSIVDIYDAATSDRVYHKALTPYRTLQALYDLGRQGRLDLRLVERFIRCIGVYPVGSCVGLNTGEVAIVRQHRQDRPLTPVLLLIRDVQYQRVNPPRVLDLGEPFRPVRRITEVFDPGSLGIDTNAYLTAAAP